MEYRNCLFCGNKFLPVRSTQIYCSHRCGRNNYLNKSKILKHCPVCGKDFWTYRGSPAKPQTIYCSRQCAGLGFSQHHRVDLICKVCGKTYSVPSWRASTSAVCSRQCHRIWRGKTYGGKNHWNWQGGKETNYTWKPEWRALRLHVLKRDKYQCKSCGETDQSKLEIHHVIPFEISNSHIFLITLCRKCHRKVHRELNHNIALSHV